MKHLVPKGVIPNQSYSLEVRKIKGSKEARTELGELRKRRKDARQGGAGPCRAGATPSSWGQWGGAQALRPASSALTCSSTSTPQPAPLRCHSVCRVCGAPWPGWGRVPSVTKTGAPTPPPREQPNLYQFSGAGRPLPTVKGWAAKKSVGRRTGRAPPEMELERAAPEDGRTREGLRGDSRGRAARRP